MGHKGIKKNIVNIIIKKLKNYNNKIKKGNNTSIKKLLR